MLFSRQKENNSVKEVKICYNGRIIMRIKKVVIPLMLIMTMAFPVVANAMPRKLVTLDGGKNYVMQHMSLCSAGM